MLCENKVITLLKALGVLGVFMLSGLDVKADTRGGHLCMAKNMYFEARNEGKLGMLLVGQVTLNRVGSKHYPSTVCGVVYQRKQFSWFSDGLSDKAPVRDVLLERVAWEDAKAIARTLLYRGNKLNDLTGGALHYHSVKVNPVWNRGMEVSLLHKNHIFYIN